MMAKITRRDAVRMVGSAAAGAYGLGLLRQHGATSVLAQDSIEIRSAGFVESQDQLKQTLAVLKRYEELNPSVKINAEFTDYGSYTDKLATEAAGGNAPDMMSANGDIMGEYSRRGVLRPLDEYVPAPLDMSGYATGTVTGNTIDGKLYGIPNDCISPSLVYDTTVFAETGIAVPEQMWTWEAYEQLANDISKAKGSDYYGTEDGGSSYIACDMYLRGRKKEFYTADKGLGFTEADLADWLGFWQRLRESGGTPPADIQALASGDDLSRTGLITGRAAILPQLTDTFVGLQNLTEKKLGLHLLPNGFKGTEALAQHHYTYAGNSTSVSSATDHADTVIDIVRFMHFDPEGIGIFYHGSGLIPASGEARAKLLQGASEGEKTVLQYIDIILQKGSTPRNPAIAGVSAILGRMNEAVGFGQMKVDEAAKQFFSEAADKIS